MQIPLLDLSAQIDPIREEILEAINRVIDSRRFIMGPEVEGLEREVAAYCQCEFGVGVSSGTDALLVALMAIGLEPGDEVITSPYTFFATAGAIARLGGKPVFVDIDRETYNLDPAGIESRITAKTRAVIPVHLFGQMAEMDSIMEVARRHGLRVIEDAAQAIGAESHGRRAGSIGDLGCFSFFPSKNLGGFGDGGMVTTNDPQLAERVRILRNHGYGPKYYNQVIGGNFRLDAMQAAVLRVKLHYLEVWTAARQENAQRYRELFRRRHSEVAASKVSYTLPIERPGFRHIYNQFVVRSSRRDHLLERLKADGIGCEIYYPVALHQQECFAYLGYSAGDFPESEQAAAETLALPIYPGLTPTMQEYVVERT